MSTFSADHVTVEMSEEVSVLMDRLAAQAGQISLTTVQGMVDEVFADAQRRWPVLSGVSKAGLTKYAKTSGGMVLVGIRNPVRYVRYIRSQREGTERQISRRRSKSGALRRIEPTWSKLVSRPLKKIVKRDVRKIAKAFVRAAGD